MEAPFSKGARSIDFDDEGRMIVDGNSKTSNTSRLEAYKNLELSHANKGHGPDKPLLEIITEARKNFNGLSSKFNSDRALLEAFMFAKEGVGKNSLIRKIGDDMYEFDLPEGIDLGSVYCVKNKVPSNSTILSIDAELAKYPDIVKMAPKRVEFIYDPKVGIIT